MEKCISCSKTLSPNRQIIDGFRVIVYSSLRYSNYFNRMSDLIYAEGVGSCYLLLSGFKNQLSYSFSTHHIIPSAPLRVLINIVLKPVVL